MSSRLAQLYPEFNAADVKAGFKSDSGALAKLRGQQSFLKGFEGGAVRNLDLANGLMSQMVDTGSPFFNRPIREGLKRFAGDPRIPAFQYALQGVRGEVAKIISGNMGNTPVNEFVTREMTKSMSDDMTPQQLATLTPVVKQEISNRMQGVADELTRTHQSIAARSKQGGAATAQVIPAAPSGGRLRIRDTKTGRMGWADTEKDVPTGAEVVK